MAKASQRPRKKEKKNIVSGVAHVNATFNNTIITITDAQGNTISWSTSGALGFKGYMGTIFFIPAGLSPPMKVLMLIILTPVELMGKIAKPFALMVRLFANMMAGHTLVLSLLGMIFLFATIGPARHAIAGASLGMVWAIMLLEVFVALLQAYIFAMLTAVFIGLIRHAH